METRFFREYLTESIRLYGQGKTYQQSWREMMEAAQKPRDTRTADEIAYEVIIKAGLTWKGGE